MEQELQTALAGLINSVLNAKDFLVAELPEVIQQLLLWKMSMSLLVTAIGLLIVVASVYGWRWTWKDMGNNGHEEFRAVCMFYSIPAIVGILMSFDLDWLQIWIAPKVYLLEYVKSIAG